MFEFFAFIFLGVIVVAMVLAGLKSSFGIDIPILDDVTDDIGVYADDLDTDVKTDFEDEDNGIN